MITKAKYISFTDPTGKKYNTTIKATINGDEVLVPLTTDNKDYVAIQEWVAAGNTIEEAD